MSGVSMAASFDDGLIQFHLARLAAAQRAKFGAVRREIGEWMLGDVQDNLDGQKLFDGSAMPQSKAAIKRSGKTLIKKHHLYDSYVYQLSEQGVAVGSNLIYAAIHHFGGVKNSKRGPVRLWPRPVLGLTAAKEGRLGDMLISAIRSTQ